MENQKHKQRFTFILLLMSLINGSIAMPQFLNRVSESPFLFGLSIQRLILVITVIALTLLLITFLFQISRKKGRFFQLFQKHILESERLDQFLFWNLVACFSFFLFFNLPSYRLGKWAGYWTMFIPFFQFMFSFFGILFSGLFVLFSDWKKRFAHEFKNKFFTRREIISILVFILVIFCILLFFKINLIQDAYYWNVAGVPILTQYAYLAFGIFFLLGIYFRVYKKEYIIIVGTTIMMAFIFIQCFFIFQNMPITRNFFVETRLAPVVEYYPYSDALKYDQASLGFINGLGINFRQTEDKPFYQAYTGLLHFIMGNKYEEVMKLNVLILSLIPVFLFLIGKEFDSNETGFLFASASILFEITTFQSSGIIANVHWKLMMPEPLAQLLILIATYGTIRWLKNNQQIKWLYLAGMMIGIGAYIRPQTIIILGGFLLIILLNKSGKFSSTILNAVKGLFSFILVTLPWAIYCQVKYGYIPLYSKFLWILSYRFSLSAITPIQSLPIKTASLFPISTGLRYLPDLVEKSYLIVAHFLNNIIKSLLILPYSLQMDKVPNVFSGIVYWDETASWNGQVSIVFYLSLIILAIGFIGLYRHKKLVSLVPVIFMLSYFLGLSLSRTSGSRYLVPVIWVIVIFYFYGIVLIARFLANLFIQSNPEKGKSGIISLPSQKTISPNQTSFLILPLLIGFLLPILDLTIPANPNLSASPEKIEALITQDEITSQLEVNPDQWKTMYENKILIPAYGKVYYPEITTLDEQSGEYRIRLNIVGNYPLDNIILPLSDISNETIEAIDFDEPFFAIRCRQKGDGMIIPILIQSSNKEILLVSKQNSRLCLTDWYIP